MEWKRKAEYSTAIRQSEGWTGKQKNRKNRFYGFRLEALKPAVFWLDGSWPKKYWLVQEWKLKNQGA